MDVAWAREQTKQRKALGNTRPIKKLETTDEAAKPPVARKRRVSPARVSAKVVAAARSCLPSASWGRFQRRIGWEASQLQKKRDLMRHVGEARRRGGCVTHESDAPQPDRERAVRMKAATRIRVEGQVSAGFEAVREALAENFSRQH